jgi:competence protein ComEA
MPIVLPDAEAIVRYREEKGSFKTLDDLKKVPGIDPGKLEAKKASLEF